MVSSPSNQCRIVFITAIARTQLSFLRGQNPFVARAGFQMHAIASPDESLHELHRRDGVQIHPVKISRKIAPLSDIISVIRLVRVLRRVQPTILHVSTPKAALLGAVAGLFALVPIRLYLVRGLATENARGVRRLAYRCLERLTSRLCHRTLFVSRSLESFARSEGIVSERSSYGVLANGMSNGINVDRFQPGPSRFGPPESDVREGQPVIGFVGRLAKDKGIEELAGAWSRLRDEFPDARLLLVGDWESEDPVSNDIRRQLEQDPRVEITGFVDDVVPYYRRMSLFAFPSHGTEGFPNAPMEAAAMALAVVATRVVGCVDAVVDGITGTLVSPRDAAMLTDAIRQYLARPAVRRSHGAAGRIRVLREFRQERIWQAACDEYVQLLESRGLPVPIPNTIEDRRAA